MKILVLQLARLGDIYQSWPALRALRRERPEVEIHVLTRRRYAEAFEGLTAIDQVHFLPTADLVTAAISSFVSEEPQPEAHALERVDEMLAPLRAENFDWIINLTFSPLSSYITSALHTGVQKTSGYTRFTDGYLALPDAMSAYFFAQVGPDRPNRFHLCEIFATLCEVDLVPSDWRAPDLSQVRKIKLPEEYICLHVGGSEKHKAISVSKWISILSQLRKNRPVSIVLLGSKAERSLADQIQTAAPEGEVQNLVGELTLIECLHVLRNARLLVGPNSAPIHMATLVDVPVLNLSLGTVKYWETGPRSLGSVVLPGKNEDDLPSDIVVEFIIRILHGQRLPLGTIQTCSGAPSYQGETTSQEEFEWQLLEAIYRGADFPAPIDPLFMQGLEQLSVINLMMIDYLKEIKSPEDLARRLPFIERGGEIIETIAKLVPSTVPMVRWYQTEKVRVGPGPVTVICRRNLESQRMLQNVIEIYRPLPEGDPQRRPYDDPSL